MLIQFPGKMTFVQYALVKGQHGSCWPRDSVPINKFKLASSCGFWLQGARVCWAGSAHDNWGGPLLPFPGFISLKSLAMIRKHCKVPGFLFPLVSSMQERHERTSGPGFACPVSDICLMYGAMAGQRRRMSDTGEVPAQGHALCYGFAVTFSFDPNNNNL